MKLLCWLVLAILLVESLQEENSSATPVSSKSSVTTPLPVSSTKATTSEEGSGEDSSEEHTVSETAANVTIPAKDQKSATVPIIPPDESAPSNSREVDADLDEAIKIALNSNPANSTEAIDASSAKTETSNSASSDLKIEVIGESNSTTTESHDGKLNAEENPPTDKQPSVSDGKSGAVVEQGQTPENSETADHGNQLQPDGKLGQMVSAPTNAENSSPGEVRSQTVIGNISTDGSADQTESVESSTSKDSSTPLSRSVTPVDEAPSNASSTVVEASTQNKASTESGNSNENSTETETATSDSSVTVVVLNNSTDVSNGTASSTESPATVATDGENDIDLNDDEKPAPDAIPIEDIQELDFQEGAMASYRSEKARTWNLTKLQCIGQFCGSVPIKFVTCNRAGNRTQSDVNNSSSRFTIPIQWTCGSADFEPEFQIKEPEVICEGYRYSGDSWIFKNSCCLVFKLDKINSSALQSKEKESDSSAIVFILTVLALFGIGFLVIKSVILKRKHGHWVPSYCALPLKARMNFRRKRQTDFDDEPVNVHFDMGEEQTSIGRNRVRSYGPQ